MRSAPPRRGWRRSPRRWRSRAREHPLCVWLDEGPAAAAFATWAAGAAPSGRVLVVVPAREPPARPFAEAIALGPLTAADVEALIAARW